MGKSGRIKDKSHHRLYRDSQNAMIAGVCAGLAEYFDFNRKALRLIAAAATIFFPPFVIIGYIILAIVLPVKPKETEEMKDDMEFWRDVNNAPSDVFSSVKHRFRELDMRLQRMEAHVTSKEFEIDRELNRSHNQGS